jgi:hypothetical protein
VGTSALQSSVNWGGGIGCNLHQPPATSANPNPQVGSVTLSGSGIAYTLNAFPAGPGTVYLIVDSGANEYYCTITTARGTCTWSQFNSAPWTTTGVNLTGAPVNATHVNFQVTSSASGPESWNFCVTSLSIVP